MTMSVGLGRIDNDPHATIMTRKALGILSTPGLLVYDDALTIDETGRIVLRVKPGGGIQYDKDGLELSPVDKALVTTTIGIDSEVDPRSEAYDRQWNARLTGLAPNYAEGSWAIGAETLCGESPTAAALGISIDDAKVNITSLTTQLRLSYDAQNFLSMTVSKTGQLEMQSVGPTSPGIDLNTGDGASTSGGIRINDGTTIESVYMSVANFELSGGGFVAVGYKLMWTQSFTIPARPDQDHVTACLGDSTIPSPDGNIVSFRVQITALNEVTIKVFTIGPFADATLPFFVLIHKLGTNVGAATSLGSPTSWAYV